jgi:ribonuclease BN (tRNA processing enzyme)
MGMIRFHILGAGGAVPTPSHTPAAYWVTVDDTSFLMDPGPGALVRLVKAEGTPDTVDLVDQVFLTHLHPDHSLDLVALLFAMHSPLLPSEVPLKIWGPRGLNGLMEQWRGIYGRWLDPRCRGVVVTEIGPGTAVDLPGGGSVAAFAVDHAQDRLSEQPMGFIIQDLAGHRVVFSGDTGACPGLEEAAAGCDLLVAECSATDAWDLNGHMSPRDVGPLCQKARPRKVALTHQYPEAAAADLISAVGHHFDGPVIQARDGDVFIVPEDCT